MTGEATMPATTLPNVHCYETRLAQGSDTFAWDFENRLTSTT